MEGVLIQRQGIREYRLGGSLPLSPYIGTSTPCLCFPSGHLQCWPLVGGGTYVSNSQGKPQHRVSEELFSPRPPSHLCSLHSALEHVLDLHSSGLRGSPVLSRGSVPGASRGWFCWDEPQPCSLLMSAVALPRPWVCLLTHKGLFSEPLSRCASGRQTVLCLSSLAHLLSKKRLLETSAAIPRKATPGLHLRGLLHCGVLRDPDSDFWPVLSAFLCVSPRRTGGLGSSPHSSWGVVRG